MNRSLLYISIAVLSWSTVATIFKIALSHFSPFEVLMIASLTAMTIHAVVLTFTKKWALIREISPKQWLLYAFVGMLNPVIYYLVLFKAYSLIPAQIVQPINYTWPIVLLILMSLFAKKAIPAMKYIGLALSLAGVAVISFGVMQLTDLNLPLSGLILALLSAFIWASYWLINTTVVRKTDAGVSLFIAFMFGSLYMLILSPIVGVDLGSTSGVLSSIGVGVFEMGLPFIFFGLALSKTKNPVLINQMCYLVPFISLIFISLILKETILPSTFLGLALIVFGVIFNEFLTRKRL